MDTFFYINFIQMTEFTNADKVFTLKCKRLNGTAINDKMLTAM